MVRTSSKRRAFLKTVGSAALLGGGAGLAAARGPGRSGRGPRRGASADATITDIAVDDGRFDSLVAALQETGLAAVLDDDGGQYTVFAPTDDAFEDLLEALDATPEELLAREDLAAILTYHVTRGRRYAASIVNAPRVKTLQGSDISVSGTTLNGGGLGGAEITATDIEASNGVIHVIDGVLLP